MKLSDYVADFLVRQGAKHIFLLPGGACMHLCDSVGKRPELDYVCCLHEQACAFAAEAYAEYTNDLSVCLVTAGPGGTNALTGAACAWIESSSVLFISGQAKRSDLIGDRGVRSMGPQEVDIVSMAKPITKYSVRLMDPTRVRYEFEKAVYLAKTGRKGPVWIDIPLDVQAAQVEDETLIPFEPAVTHTCNPFDQLLQASIALKKAKRPVIYAGNGIRSAGMVTSFNRLVERLGVPVLLTWKAADFLPDNHPAYIGRPGGMGQRAANFAQQKADWLLVLGARLDLPSIAFSHGNFAPNAYKTFVDVDQTELDKFNAHIDQQICANLYDALPALDAALSQAGVPDFSHWLRKCRSWVDRFPVVLPEYWEARDGVSTYVLIDVLSQHAKSSDVIVPGSSGPCSDILMQAWRVKEGQRILNAPGLGAMGTGLPGTVGACLASGRRVINVNGDGGFQLNIQELETVRRLGLPVKYFVLANGGYGSIITMQRNHFHGRLVGSNPDSRLTLPDTKRLAEAFGIPSFSVDSHEALKSTVEQVLALRGPAICVVKVFATEVTQPRATSEVRADGKIVTLPMEDMHPRLDRSEFASIMSDDNG